MSQGEITCVEKKRSKSLDSGMIIGMLSINTPLLGHHSVCVCPWVSATGCQALAKETREGEKREIVNPDCF